MARSRVAGVMKIAIGTGYREGPSPASFKKGEDGRRNNKGRPKKPQEWHDARALARKHTPEAIECLLDLMRNDPDGRTRLVAASTLLDRAYGKPAQAVNIDASVQSSVTHKISEMSDAELMALASQASEVIDLKTEE